MIASTRGAGTCRAYALTATSSLPIQSLLTTAREAHLIMAAGPVPQGIVGLGGAAAEAMWRAWGQVVDEIEAARH